MTLFILHSLYYILYITFFNGLFALKIQKTANQSGLYEINLISFSQKHIYDMIFPVNN